MKQPLWLARRLGIEPGEGRLVLLLFALAFFAAGAFVLSYVAGNALFIATYGAEGLPYNYIAAAVLLVLAGSLFTRAERSVPLALLLVAPWVGLALAGGALYWGLRANGAPWLTFAAMIWSWVISVFADLGLWALAGRLFNLAQGKRLFGLVGGGGLVARLVLYLGSGLAATAIGTVNLLLVAIACMVMAMALTTVTLRRLPARAPAPQPASGPAAAHRAPPRDSRRSHYMLLILALVLLGELAYGQVEFFFFQQVGATYSDPDDLARVVGLFAGVTYGLALLVSATLTGVALRRLGVRFALVAQSALVMLGMAVTLGIALVAPAAGGLIFAVVMGSKVLDDTARGALTRPARQLLFQPIPAAERVRAQSIAASVVDPLALGLNGVVLLGFGALGALGAAPLAAGALALLLPTIVLSVLTYRGYVAALGRALSRRLVGSATISLDAAGLAVVERALASRRSVEVLSALDILQSERPELYRARLPAMLTHADPGVRREALARVGALGLSETLPAVRAAADGDHDPSVRAAAVGALARLGADAGAALADPDPEVRLAALVGQLRRGDPVARDALADLAAGADPAGRALAARMAGAAGDDMAIGRLLGDPEPTVRRAALRAVTPATSAPIWPLVTTALDDHHCRGAAMDGLEAGGEVALAFFTPTLDDPATPGGTRALLARACGRIRGPTAVATLLRQLDIPDDQLREAVVAALRRCDYAAGKAEAPIRARIADELSTAIWCATAAADLAAEPRATMLRQALLGQQERLTRRALTLLGFIVGPRLARQIADGLAAPSPERRAYAAELLETRVRPDLRAPFAPLLVTAPDPRPGAAAPRLRAILASSHAAVTPWVRACGLYAAGLIGTTDLTEIVRGLLVHPAPLVREQAAWALARLAGQTPQEQEMLTTVERVIILKGVGIFAAAPDPVLAELAALLEEEEAPAGRAIFAQGEPGSSLYIIVEGEVRVHDAVSTFNHLGEREVFGEMALLTPAPRSASVTAMVDTLLLRLDNEPFQELMEDRIEIARGVIAVLTARLRDRMRDLEEARRG